MMTDITGYLIVCPLALLAGFVDAVAGGGGLISLPAYIISGLPVHYAIGTNKLSSGMGTAIAAWKLSKYKYIPWKLALCCAACALAASNLGAHLALLLDDKVFKMLLLLILPLTAVYVFKSGSLETEHAAYSSRKTLGMGMLIAAAIGVYDGFYGPGTGAFLLLLLTGAAHMKLKEANGTAKIINLTTNLSGLAVLLYYGKVMVLLGITAGIFSIAGNCIGTRFFARGGARVVKPVIIFVISVFFVKVLLELI